MADNEIVVEIVGKIDSIEKSINALERSVEKKGTAIGAGLVAGITASITTVGLKAIAEAGSKIGEIFTKAIGEATEAGKALQLFNSSLAASGNFSQKASLDFQEYAASLQRATGISDDFILSQASVLASLGRLSGEGLERATKAAIDFSASGIVSLETSFDILAKAANGSIGALTRYGIKIDENLPKSERFAEALRQLEARFGGLAGAQVNTFAGSLKLLSANFNDILENLGKFVTESPVVIALIKFLGNAFADVAKQLEVLRKGDVVGGLIKDLLAIGKVLATSIVPGLEIVFNLGVAGFNALKTTVQFFITALAEIPLILVQIAGGAIAFTQVIGMLIGLFKQDLGKKITEGLANAGQAVIDFGANARSSLEGTLGDFASQTGESISNIFDVSASEGLEGFISKLQSVADRAAPIGNTIKQQIGGAFTEVDERAKRAFDSINKNFQQGVLNVISTGAQALGASLLRGGKAFDNFKNVVLGIIGDMAIQIGTTLIGIGIGIESLKASLLTLSGGAAIAAGIALIAIGGLLKALSSGSAGESIGVGGGVGTPATGAPVGGGEFGALPDTATRPGTAITVNVQGNILDRRESGLEIAQVIQEFFDSNGKVLATGNV